MSAGIFQNKDTTQAKVQYRDGAALLNNIGVSLLAQGAFGDAMSTLLDAVIVMRNVCCVKNAIVHQNSRCIRLTSICLANAQERLASPQTYPDFVLPLTDAAVPPTPPFILQLDDSDHFEILKNSLHHPQDIFIFPAIVELHHHSCRCSGYVDFTRNLDAAIMTYNLGLSYVCLSRWLLPEQPQAQVLRQAYQDAAIQHFGLSESILQQCQDNACGDMAHKQDCIYFDRKAMHIARLRMAVLHIWYQILEQQQQQQQQRNNDNSHVADMLFSSLLSLQNETGRLDEGEPEDEYTLLKQSSVAAAA